MKKTQLPEIRIIDAWLLRQNASKHLHELWGKGTDLADDESIEKIVNGDRDAWKPFEQKILTGMTEILSWDKKGVLIAHRIGIRGIRRYKRNDLSKFMESK